MISAVDSSVILDVLAGRGSTALASERVLRRARAEGRLILCECVLAEVHPALPDEQLFQEFLQDWQLDFVPSSRESALLAGRFYARYLERKGGRQRVLPDFLIGAHARIHADRLVARDRGYWRDCFQDLVLLDPGG